MALLAGLLCWAGLASLLNAGLRLGLAGYAAAEPTRAYSLTMLWARLGIALVASLVAGALVARIAPAHRRAPWLLALLLLAYAVPRHAMIWAHYPAWYHLFFLGTLAPAVALGGRLSLSQGIRAAGCGRGGGGL